MNKKEFNQSGWDVLDSSYIQVISLQNGKEFVGYSKKMGFAEKNDKQALLINWIVRMHKTGYLDIHHKDRRRRVSDIEYFMNSNPSRIPLIRLNYHFYECMNTKWAINNPAVIQFLDHFYAALKTGDNSKVQSLYIHERKRFEDPFNLSNQRFVSKAALMNYCHQMVAKNKFTQEQALAFHHKYNEKYFNT